VSVSHAARGHLTQPGFAHPVMGAMPTGIHGSEVGQHEFTRNAFGDRSGWNHWGGRYDGRWHRWHGWYGPVFWPFLYGDILSFSFFDDYNPFWAYDPDAFLSTIYWPGPYGYDPAATPGVTQALQSDASLPLNASAACGQLAPGVTDLPIDQIRQVVHPNGAQNTALDNLQAATIQARAVIDGACPIQAPITPIARLDAVQQRIGAMIQAVEIVRGPLEAFYGSLSEGQKASLAQATAAGTATARRVDSVAQLCDPNTASFAELPMDNIERALQPTSQQEGAFEALKAASASAASQLSASCPATTPQTPVERMDAVATRLTAMSRAAESLRPALTAFYAELDATQKARFDNPALS
jgi:hypothetical protein